MNWWFFGKNIIYLISRIFKYMIHLHKLLNNLTLIKKVLIDIDIENNYSLTCQPFSSKLPLYPCVRCSNGKSFPSVLVAVGHLHFLVLVELKKKWVGSVDVIFLFQDIRGWIVILLMDSSLLMGPKLQYTLSLKYECSSLVGK